MGEDDRERQGPDAEHFQRFFRVLDQMKQSAPPAYLTTGASDDVPVAQNCFLCRWCDHQEETCRWASANPLPLTLPFWIRASIVYIDADDGQSCGAFEPHLAEGGR